MKVRRVPGPCVDPYQVFHDAFEDAARAAISLWQQHRVKRGEPDDEELAALHERIVGEIWIQLDERGVEWP